MNQINLNKASFAQGKQSLQHSVMAKPGYYSLIQGITSGSNSYNPVINHGSKHYLCVKLHSNLAGSQAA